MKKNKQILLIINNTKPNKLLNIKNINRLKNFNQYLCINPSVMVMFLRSLFLYERLIMLFLFAINPNNILRSLYFEKFMN